MGKQDKLTMMMTQARSVHTADKDNCTGASTHTYCAFKSHPRYMNIAQSWSCGVWRLEVHVCG